MTGASPAPDKTPTAKRGLYFLFAHRNRLDLCLAPLLYFMRPGSAQQRVIDPQYEPWLFTNFGSLVVRNNVFNKSSPFRSKHYFMFASVSSTRRIRTN